jgi:hypothetical protein
LVHFSLKRQYLSILNFPCIHRKTEREEALAPSHGIAVNVFYVFYNAKYFMAQSWERGILNWDWPLQGENSLRAPIKMAVKGLASDEAALAVRPLRPILAANPRSA